MSNFDEIREWLEKANKDWEPKYKRFNIWLPIDKLPIESSDILAYRPADTPDMITHRAVPAPIVPALEKVWFPLEYQEKYRKGYKIFIKNKEKEQNND